MELINNFRDLEVNSLNISRTANEGIIFSEENRSNLIIQNLKIFTFFKVFAKIAWILLVLYISFSNLKNTLFDNKSKFGLRNLESSFENESNNSADYHLNNTSDEDKNLYDILHISEPMSNELKINKVIDRLTANGYSGRWFSENPIFQNSIKTNGNITFTTMKLIHTNNVVSIMLFMRLLDGDFLTNWIIARSNEIPKVNLTIINNKLTINQGTRFLLHGQDFSSNNMTECI